MLAVCASLSSKAASAAALSSAYASAVELACRPVSRAHPATAACETLDPLQPDVRLLPRNATSETLYMRGRSDWTSSKRMSIVCMGVAVAQERKSRQGSRSDNEQSFFNRLTMRTTSNQPQTSASARLSFVFFNVPCHIIHSKTQCTDFLTTSHDSAQAKCGNYM